MIALTRLFIGNARGARVRLAGIAAGVMIGVALFLLLWGASEHLGERSERGTWATWAYSDQYLSDAAALPDDGAVIGTGMDFFDGTVIPVLRIASTATTTMTMPGIDAIPGPGEYVASPAMTRLISETPHELLGDRFGTPIGEISKEGLESPDQLLVVVGHSVDEMLAAGRDMLVTELVGQDYVSPSYRILVVIGAIATLIPVMLLIAIVTDLGSAQRAERVATLRLIGATPRRVSSLTAIETAVTTLIGALLGIGLYFFLIPLAMRIQVGTGRFYYDDLVASPAGMLLAVGVAAGLSTLVAWWRSLRSDIGPLGGSRERHERVPRFASTIPLACGVLSLVAIGALGVSGQTIPMAMLVSVGSFLLVIVGLLWAGPYLTCRVAAFVEQRTPTATGVIAMSRISRRPRATFRAVSGLIVAVFTATVFAAAITSAVGVSEAPDGPGMVPSNVLRAYVAGGPQDPALARTVETVSVLEGVTAVAIAREGEDGSVVVTAADAAALAPDAVISPAAQWVGIGWGGTISDEVDPTAMNDGAFVALLVATDGAPASIERSRTALATSDLSFFGEPSTRADTYAQVGLAPENQFAALAYLGILVATGLSAVALAVSALASVIERKRVFGLLRLGGLSDRGLRRVVAMEALVPVVTVFAGSIGFGVLTSWGLVEGLTSGRRSIGWPDASYYVVLAVCAALMVVAISGTFRAAVRATGGEVTRFE